MNSIFFDVFRRLSQSQLNEITIDQERCIDFHRKEKKELCTACQENCVVTAISIGERINIDWNKCIRCGICAAVCPTEVFTMQVLSDNMILNCISEQSDTEPVMIECNFVNGQFEGKEKHPRTKGKKIIVPCTARFSETFLLQSSLVSGDRLKIAQCTKDCTFNNGKKVAEELQRRSRVLLDRFSASQPKDKPTKDRTLSERRYLLGEAGLQAINMLLPTNASSTNQLRSIDKIPSHRASLIELVKNCPPSGEPFNRGKMPFGAVTIDPEKCRLHGSCAEACPTGALRLLDDNQEKKLVFLYGACIGCGACIYACPEGATKLEETVDLTRLSAPWATLMARQYRLCTSCGRQFSANMGADVKVCPSCVKRWAEIERYSDESTG